KREGADAGALVLNLWLSSALLLLLTLAFALLAWTLLRILLPASRVLGLLLLLVRILRLVLRFVRVALPGRVTLLSHSVVLLSNVVRAYRLERRTRIDAYGGGISARFPAR